LTAKSSLKAELSVDSTHFSRAATTDPDILFDKKSKIRYEYSLHNNKKMDLKKRKN
jgi:hypothetical protein